MLTFLLTFVVMLTFHTPNVADQPPRPPIPPNVSRFSRPGNISHYLNFSHSNCRGPTPTPSPSSNVSRFNYPSTFVVMLTFHRPNAADQPPVLHRFQVDFTRQHFFNPADLLAPNPHACAVSRQTQTNMNQTEPNQTTDADKSPRPPLPLAFPGSFNPATLSFRFHMRKKNHDVLCPVKTKQTQIKHTKPDCQIQTNTDQTEPNKRVCDPSELDEG